MSLNDSAEGERAAAGQAAAVRHRWIEMIEDRGPVACPVCYHVPKLRQHAFTTTMALALIFLYHSGGPVEEKRAPSIVKTGDSLKKLVMWGLALEEGGAYRLAPDGHEVVVKRATVPRYCMSSGGYALWFSAARAWIDETLNQRYSYEELMKESG